MKDIKNKLNKNIAFNSMSAIAVILIAYSAYNITQITQSYSNINNLENRIEREKRNVVEAEMEINEIEKEFANIETSTAPSLDGRSALIIRDIKRLIQSYDIDPMVEASNSQTGSYDNETGLKTININVQLDYTRYSDVKEMMIELRKTFPIVINEMVFSESNASFSFIMYGA